MELAFQSFEVRKLCESQDYAESMLTRAGARRLRTFVADLRAAYSMNDFLALHSPAIEGDHFAVVLSENEELSGRQGHLHAPSLEGCIDWSNVYRVRILSIGGNDA